MSSSEVAGMVAANPVEMGLDGLPVFEEKHLMVRMVAYQVFPGVPGGASVPNGKRVVVKSPAHCFFCKQEWTPQLPSECPGELEPGSVVFEREA